MTGAAGNSPDTAGTDPLIGLRTEIVRVVSTCDVIRSYGKWVPPLPDEASRIADAVLAAVHAHQNSRRQTSAQVLRDAADAWDPNGLHDIRDWLRSRADTLELS